MYMLSVNIIQLHTICWSDIYELVLNYEEFVTMMQEFRYFPERRLEEEAKLYIQKNKGTSSTCLFAVFMTFLCSIVTIQRNHIKLI